MDHDHNHPHEHQHARVNAKVAVATDDGLTVRETFAGATYYAVLTVRESDIVHSELRDAPRGSQASDVENTLALLTDCQVALARRVGFVQWPMGFTLFIGFGSHVKDLFPMPCVCTTSTKSRRPVVRSLN